MANAVNILVTVPDPDRLIAGESPYAPFVVTTVQLYRWTTEALARAGNAASGTLVTSWALIASTQPITDTAGPYRFAYYDGSQGIGSWYRYRFMGGGGINLSAFSEPWQADNRDQTVLRDLLFEVGDLMGQSAIKGTATAGAAGTVTCPTLFQSTLRDQRLYEGWWLMVTQDAGLAGAVPEGEEALIASVDRSTGVATLERSLSSAIGAGDIVTLFSYLQPSEMVRCINRALSEMKVLSTIDIALTGTEYRYPAPAGVTARTQVIGAKGVQQFSNSNREDEFPIRVDLEFDGIRGWLVFDPDPSTNLARVQYTRSYRDLEGQLAIMSDTTSAPYDWVVPAAAFKCAQLLVNEDPEEPAFAKLYDEMSQLAATASGTYAPEFNREMKRANRLLPGPVAFV